MTISEGSAMNPTPPAAGSGAPGGNVAVGLANPAALTVEQLARMLAVSEEKVREHVAAGAPVGADGTINLVNYAAWLNRQLAGSDGD
jgi:plasmid maintenance system antidote protein VapI